MHTVYETDRFHNISKNLYKQLRLTIHEYLKKLLFEKKYISLEFGMKLTYEYTGILKRLNQHIDRYHKYVTLIDQT